MLKGKLGPSARDGPIGGSYGALMGHRAVVAGLAAVVLTVLSAGCGREVSTGSSAGSSAATGQPCADHEVDHTGSAVTPGTELAAPADEAGRLQLLADAFCGRWTEHWAEGTGTSQAVLPPDDARCIAAGLIARLGPDRIATLQLDRHGWSLIGFGLGRGTGLRDEEASTMVDVFAGCSARFERLLIFSVTEGTDGISEESGACVADRLDDEVARDILQAEMTRDYGSRTIGEVLDPLVKAYDDCLTPAERDRVDFN